MEAFGRRADEFERIPGNAFYEDEEAALDAGMNGHLAKPVDADKLMETLEEILSTETNQ